MSRVYAKEEKEKEQPKWISFLQFWIKVDTLESGTQFSENENILVC